MKKPNQEFRKSALEALDLERPIREADIWNAEKSMAYLVVGHRSVVAESRESPARTVSIDENHVWVEWLYRHRKSIGSLTMVKRSPRMRRH